MECPVCFEIYDTPLLLPGCGHTICRSCAEALITEHNFLRCPECRLVYQLRQGIKSLPKNVALERTIDEHALKSPSGRMNVRCEEHPDDAVALYCKTCEKSICLKCYFNSNTLRKGEAQHVGHQVDTSEDAFTKEKRLFEDKKRMCEDMRKREREYVKSLEDATEKLKQLMESKTAGIEKNKNDAMAQIKQTCGKLKFTLKGSVARDQEFLQMALQGSRERLAGLERSCEKADQAMLSAAQDDIDVNEMKEVRRELEEKREPGEHERPAPESFLKISNFDTDLQPCLDDPKKALSYQTEPPRAPEIVHDECVVSDDKIFILIKYDEHVRVKKLTLNYKEAIYKGMSEKQGSLVEIEDFRRGHAKYVLKDLKKGTMYRMTATASNDFGNSPTSPEVWFRTVDTEVEIRKT